MNEQLKLDCQGSDGLALSPFAPLQWGSLYLSPSCAVLSAQAKGEPTPKERQELRDRLSDLGDDLRSFGLALPLLLAVECTDDKQYGDWHQLAGNQDWHRGSFAIEVYDQAHFQAAGIVSFSDYLNLLTNPASIGASPFELKQITAEDYAQILRDKLPELQDDDELAGRFNLPLYRALIESLIPEIRSGGEPERGVNAWLDTVVVATAQKALEAPAS